MAGNTRIPFASLAALAAVASAHSAETSASAVESAKRDLQELPVAEQPVDAAGRPSLFSGSTAIPGLSLTSPAPGASSPKKTDATDKAPSGGWLLDGVRGLEAEAKQRELQAGKRATEAAASGNAANAGGPAKANPLGDYLTQWLAPRDQALLLEGPSANGLASSEGVEFDRAREREALTTTASPFQTELPGLVDLGVNKRGVNPYLVDPLQPAATSSPFTAAVGDRGLADARPTAALAPQLTLPFAAPPAEPVAVAKPAPSPAPTSRIVDDRKYFPQLRRF